MNRGRVLCIAAVLSALGPFGISTADATERLREWFTGRTHPLSARSASGRVTATLRYAGGNLEHGGYRYRLASQRAGVSSAITFPSIIIQSFELDVTDRDDRATVIGWATTGGMYAFDVVDMASAKLVVEVPCYRPVVSPSGRYIAFVQWFAPHLTNLARQTAVYRVAEIARLPQKRADEVMDKYVGTEVYPKAPLRIPSNSLSMDDGEIHQIRGISFDWTDDSHFSFVDLYRHHETTVDVAIGPSGLNEVHVTTR